MPQIAYVPADREALENVRKIDSMYDRYASAPGAIALQLSVRN